VNVAFAIAVPVALVRIRSRNHSVSLSSGRKGGLFPVLFFTDVLGHE